MVQVVECLPSKCNALSSNPSTYQKKKKRKKKKKEEKEKKKKQKQLSLL
jgi:DNA primase large subunit